MGKSCSEVERAYIAGFLDADGAIMACIEKHKEKRFGFRVRVALKVTQHNRGILDWIQRTVHAGAVRANRPGDIRQTYDLLIRDRGDVRIVLQLLLPYLRAKRKQAQMTLRILDREVKNKTDLIRNARLADALSRFNIRSKNRRKNFVMKIEEHLSPND